MEWIEPWLVALVLLAGAGAFFYVLWTRRLRHVWRKRGDLEVVRPAGFFTGAWEVLTQSVVLRNRPLVGLFHLPLFYGLVAFLAKSVLHVLGGLGVRLSPPPWYTLTLDVFAVAVLASVAFMAARRYFVEREKLTDMAESGAVLSLIALLMITHLLEHVTSPGTAAGRLNWWVHYLDLVIFPAVIAHGKHLHLLVAPVNVVLKHMAEVPGDRPVFGGDLNMEDEEKLEAEYARLGMPNGTRDFSFGPLFDGAACILCGRCNDACPAGPALRPREHFVQSLRDPALDGEGLAHLLDPTVAATCVQCRACDTVCPTGCRPALNALEIRGRLALEGHYPPRAVRERAVNPILATGNIFSTDPGERRRFVEENGLPLYDPEAHDLLLVLGCQGGNHPDVQPIVVATGKLLNAAGVRWGVLPEEKCWGEGLLHGGGLMEEWPMWAPERIAFLTEALGGDRSRPILTICPHCRDTIRTQYGALGAAFTDVRLHTPYLAELVRTGRLPIEPRPLEAALHLPCKVVHNDEHAGLKRLLRGAGLALHEPETAGFATSCCGGGGGGFLWDSPAKVNRKRWQQIQATGQKRVVTGCPGCHRMLGVVRDEDATIADVATVLLERLEA